MLKYFENHGLSARACFALVALTQYILTFFLFQKDLLSNYHVTTANSQFALAIKDAQLKLRVSLQDAVHNRKSSLNHLCVMVYCCFSYNQQSLLLYRAFSAMCNNGQIAISICIQAQVWDTRKFILCYFNFFMMFSNLRVVRKDTLAKIKVVALLQQPCHQLPYAQLVKLPLVFAAVAVVADALRVHNAK